MKRVLVGILGLCILFGYLNFSDSNNTYVSGRDTVYICSGKLDFEHQESNLYSPVTPGMNISSIITLPCEISNLTYMNFTIWNNESTKICVNLTVNNITLLDSYSLNAGSEVTVNLTNYTNAGGDLNLTYIYWIFSSNQTDDEYINITLKGDDVTIASRYLELIEVKEKDKSTPEVGIEREASFFAVEDKIKLKNEFKFNISDINLTVCYPPNAVNKPVRYIYVDNATVNQTIYKRIGYIKYAPYIYDIQEPVYEDNQYTLEVTVKSYENLIDCVRWEIDPDSSFWKDYFPKLNYDTLEITINDESVEFSQGSIILENISLDDGYNDVVFTWTPTTEYFVPVTGEKAWWQEYIGPLPVWFVVIISILAIIGMGIAVYYAVRE